jgi:hypothetical protein
MGLLDDAIKEHLELKRRRGADPGEVERLEREALGPVRRAPQASDEVALEEPAERAGVFDEQAGSSYDEATRVVHPDEAEFEYEDEPAAAEAEPLLEEHPLGSESEHEPFPFVERDRGWAHDDGEAWEAEEPLAPEDPSAPAADTPAPPPPPPAATTPPPEPAPRAADSGGETVEYDVEAEQRKEVQKDDVLEETPEFLQDTPDHDRLWFEQRPPKDFDFDK